MVFAIVALVSIGLIYLTPSVIGISLRHPHLVLLLLANIITGWTVIGWALCFAWAMHHYEKSTR